MEGAHPLARQLVGTAWGPAGAPRPSPRVVHAVQRVDVKILALWAARESGRPQFPTPHDPPHARPRPAPPLPRPQPRPSPHPLHEALGDAPGTAAALQVLQELAVEGRGRVRGGPAPPRPPWEDSRRLGPWWLPGSLKGCHVHTKGPLIMTWETATCSDFVLDQHYVPRPEILSQLA